MPYVCGGKNFPLYKIQPKVGERWEKAVCVDRAAGAAGSEVSFLTNIKRKWKMKVVGFRPYARLEEVDRSNAAIPDK